MLSELRSTSVYVWNLMRTKIQNFQAVKKHLKEKLFVFLQLIQDKVGLSPDAVVHMTAASCQTVASQLES